MIELQELLDCLPETERVSLREDIRTKMNRAERGELTFGSGRDYEVDQIVSTRIVLEIRVIDHSSWDDGDPEQEPLKRHTRLYFTEPDHLPDCLLALGVASKCPGPEGLEEQNRQARTVAQRAEQHCARR
jgi:hypothetical protein